MEVRNSGLDSLSFLLTSVPPFHKGEKEPNIYLSLQQAGELYDRIREELRCQSEKPAYDQSFVKGNFRGLYVRSTPQRTHVSVSVPSLMFGHNVNAYPIHDIGDFIDEVTQRLGIDVSNARISRLDICINVNSTNPLSDLVECYHPGKRRFSEIVVNRQTKYFKSKSREMCIYSQVNRYRVDSKGQSYVQEILRDNPGIHDLIRWELRLLNKTLRVHRTTLNDLKTGDSFAYLENKFTSLHRVAKMDPRQQQEPHRMLRQNDMLSCRDFKLALVRIGALSVGLPIIRNQLLAVRDRISRGCYQNLNRLVNDLFEPRKDERAGSVSPLNHVDPPNDVEPIESDLTAPVEALGGVEPTCDAELTAGIVALDNPAQRLHNLVLVSIEEIFDIRQL